MAWHADFSSPDTLRCKLWDADYKYARSLEIVEAVNERTPSNSTPITLDRLALWPDFRLAIENKINSLLIRYVNLNYGLDHTGDADIVCWTQSSLMAYLGVDRIPWQLSLDIPAWYHQQYLILNALRQYFITVNRWAGIKTKFVSNKATWAAAETDFNAAGWTVYGAGYIEPQHYSTKNGYGYGIARVAAKPAETNPFTINADMIFWDQDGSGGTYENNDYPAWEPVGTYTKIYDYGTVAPGDHEGAYVGDIVSNTQSEPDIGETIQWRLSHTEAGPPFSKPPIYGGHTMDPQFVYKDW